MQSNGDNQRINNTFSVDKLLEAQVVENTRTKRKSENEDNVEEIQIIKKPLKFGVDRILRGDDNCRHTSISNCHIIPSAKAISSSSSSQPDYLTPYYQASYTWTGSICDSQCIPGLNKPMLSNELCIYPIIQSVYPIQSLNNNPYAQQMMARSTAITANNIEESIYSTFQNHYNLNSHHNSLSILRKGEHSSSNSIKKKKSWNRAVFSNLQRKGLEKRFLIQKYITKPDRRSLAASLNLSDSQVKVWFQNRRMKWRHSKEYRDDLSKTHTNKKQELISNFPTKPEVTEDN